MYSEKEADDEPEVRYNQIVVPVVDLNKYLANGWELVGKNGLTATIRKELGK